MTKNYFGWLNAKNAVELYFDDKQAFDKAMHLLLDLFRHYKDYKSVCRAVYQPKYEVLKPLMGVFNEGTLFICPEVQGKTEEDWKNPLTYHEYDSGKEAERMENIVRESRGTYKLRQTEPVESRGTYKLRNTGSDKTM